MDTVFEEEEEEEEACSSAFLFSKRFSVTRRDLTFSMALRSIQSNRFAARVRHKVNVKLAADVES